jgi:murein L,D-transpeptidase YcbB/YkuD
MPNRDGVYMHDTPLRQHFADNYRFLSHGCVRVDGIYDLAAWLLNGANAAANWSPEQLVKASREGSQKKLALSEPVPVAWVYLDAWESADGVVHFAPDIYNLDGAGD